jgi:murein DD-endopeptidase MepM/ murein hydrolase activator NlpD
MVLQFWFLENLQKEGDTDGGTYNPRGPGKFKGYANKDTSPYKLPYAKGEALYCGQANQGLWSHNDLSNTGSSQQCYAYDFGHDHRHPVHAARGGIVWAFVENNADNSEASPNMIVIRHNANDAEHDDPFGTGAVTTYARYLHGAQNGITDAFASRGLPPPVPEQTNPGAGTVVNQGDVIMLADDTGLSFHSHLHMDVMMDMSGTVIAPGGVPSGPGTTGIPFVFREVRGDGRPLNLTWYESDNG